MAPRQETLVLCKNTDHCRKAFAALGLDARYEPWHSALAGSRFKRVIWLAGEGDSCHPTEQLAMEEVKKMLVTKLHIGGELHIL